MYNFTHQEVLLVVSPQTTNYSNNLWASVTNAILNKHLFSNFAWVNILGNTWATILYALEVHRQFCSKCQRQFKKMNPNKECAEIRSWSACFLRKWLFLDFLFILLVYLQRVITWHQCFFSNVWRNMSREGTRRYERFGKLEEIEGKENRCIPNGRISGSDNH